MAFIILTGMLPRNLHKCFQCAVSLEAGYQLSKCVQMATKATIMYIQCDIAPHSVPLLVNSVLEIYDINGV